MPVTKVSYGYSGCITNHKQQLQAKEYLKEGVEIFILSSREEPEGMLLIADYLGIPHDNVFATGDNDVKIEKIRELRVDVHYDTNPYVIDALGDTAEEVIPAETQNINVKILK